MADGRRALPPENSRFCFHHADRHKAFLDGLGTPSPGTVQWFEAAGRTVCIVGFPSIEKLTEFVHRNFYTHTVKEIVHLPGSTRGLVEFTMVEQAQEALRLAKPGVAVSCAPWPIMECRHCIGGGGAPPTRPPAPAAPWQQQQQPDLPPTAPHPSIHPWQGPAVPPPGPQLAGPSPVGATLSGFVVATAGASGAELSHLAIPGADWRSPEDQFHYYGGIRRKYVGDPAQLKVFLDSVTSEGLEMASTLEQLPAKVGTNWLWRHRTLKGAVHLNLPSGEVRLQGNWEQQVHLLHLLKDATTVWDKPLVINKNKKKQLAIKAQAEPQLLMLNGPTAPAAPSLPLPIAAPVVLMPVAAPIPNATFLGAVHHAAHNPQVVDSHALPAAPAPSRILDDRRRQSPRRDNGEPRSDRRRDRTPDRRAPSGRRRRSPSDPRPSDAGRRLRRTRPVGRNGRSVRTDSSSSSDGSLVRPQRSNGHPRRRSPSRSSSRGSRDRRPRKVRRRSRSGSRGRRRLPEPRRSRSRSRSRSGRRKRSRSRSRSGDRSRRSRPAQPSPPRAITMPAKALVPYTSDDERPGKEKARSNGSVPGRERAREERPKGRPGRSPPPLGPPAPAPDPLDEWFLDEAASPPVPVSNQPLRTTGLVSSRTVSRKPFDSEDALNDAARRTKVPPPAPPVPARQSDSEELEEAAVRGGIAIPVLPEELLRRRPARFTERPIAEAQAATAWQPSSSSSAGGSAADGTVDSFAAAPVPAAAVAGPPRPARRPSPEHAGGRPQQPRGRAAPAARQTSPPEDYKPSFAGLLERCTLERDSSLTSHRSAEAAGQLHNEHLPPAVTHRGFLYPFTPELNCLNRPVRSEKVCIKRIGTPWDHPCIKHFGLFVADGCSLEAGEDVLCYAGQVGLGNERNRLPDCIAPLVEPSEPGGPCCQVDGSQWGNEARYINDYRLVQDRPNCWLAPAVRYDEAGLPYRTVTTREALGPGQELVMDYGVDFWDVALALVRDPKVVVQPNAAVEWPLPGRYTSCVLWDGVALEDVARFARPQRMPKVALHRASAPGLWQAVAAETILRGEAVGTIGGRVLAATDPVPPGAAVYRLPPSEHGLSAVQAENEAQWFQPCPPVEANCAFRPAWGATGRLYLAITAVADVPAGEPLRMARGAPPLPPPG